jgi:hypothetical protein
VVKSFLPGLPGLPVKPYAVRFDEIPGWAH